jgi:outer membrane protein TolC
VAQESVELATQQLKDAQNRFSAGTVPRFTVLRAEVELASVKPQLIRSKNEHLIAQLQLAKTLALDPGVKGKPTFHCVGQLEISDRPLDIEESLTLGRARRPSLKALREQMLADKEGIKVALAGFKPELNMNAGVRLQNKIGTNHLDKTMDGYFLGVTGIWRIFDSFETVGQVAQAKARLRSDTLAYEDAVRQVELEVQRAYADLRQFRETIESQQKNVQQALEALRLAQERLSAGAGTQLEVLDARVALTRARTTELQARGDYVRSLAEFDRATATQTVYAEQFKDPLQKLEQQVLRRDYSFLFKP